MKILFLTENFPPETNAAASRVFERALYWVKDNHEVTVITSAPNFPNGIVFKGYKNRWYQQEVIDGIRVVRVKTFISQNHKIFLRSLDFLSFGFMGFIAGLLQNRPDIVVATSPQFFSAVAGWLISACRKLPFVFELGDLWPASIVAVGAIQEGLFFRLIEKIELFLYRKSARVIALTHAFRDNLIDRGIDKGKIDVVINGVDLDRYTPQERQRELVSEWQLDNKFVVGYIGTHGMAHGLTNVLNAAEKCRSNPSIMFLLVGAGAERNLLISIAKQKKLTNVVFIPMQPKEQMPAIWSLCDIALVHLKNSPAFAKVIPSKMFEAMAMGLPLILCLPDGEARKILDRHRAGLWVKPENPVALVDSIEAILNNQELKKELAANALRAAPQHSRYAQANKMIHVFNQVLNGSHGK